MTDQPTQLMLLKSLLILPKNMGPKLLFLLVLKVIFGHLGMVRILAYVVLQTQSIVKSILSSAKTYKIDLIVMGSHGRKGFDKLLLGSVANGVSQKVKCPVLIIK